MMTRFWIELPGYPHGPMAFGVTAGDLDQAFALVGMWFAELGYGADRTAGLWSSAIVTENVDVSELQSRGDLPLSHFCLPRNVGIWYPAIALRAERFQRLSGDPVP